MQALTALQDLTEIAEQLNTSEREVLSLIHICDNDIPYSWGTAVNVMPMVFGNLNNESGTGVAFTRDPATGENKLMGEFLINAQGEDVVAGVRTPMPIRCV